MIIDEKERDIGKGQKEPRCWWVKLSHILDPLPSSNAALLF